MGTFIYQDLVAYSKSAEADHPSDVRQSFNTDHRLFYVIL